MVHRELKTGVAEVVEAFKHLKVTCSRLQRLHAPAVMATVEIQTTHWTPSNMVANKSIAMDAPEWEISKSSTPLDKVGWVSVPKEKEVYKGKTVNKGNNVSRNKGKGNGDKGKGIKTSPPSSPQRQTPQKNLPAKELFTDFVRKGKPRPVIGKEETKSLKEAPQTKGVLARKTELLKKRIPKTLAVLVIRPKDPKVSLDTLMRRMSREVDVKSNNVRVLHTKSGGYLFEVPSAKDSEFVSGAVAKIVGDKVRVARPVRTTTVLLLEHLTVTRQ